MEPTTMEQKSNGALVGTIIIIVILILGGIYLWTSKVEPQMEENNNVEEVQNDALMLEAYTELESIDEDLSTMDTNVSTGIEAVQ
jgi:hypothetical protein